LGLVYPNDLIGPPPTPTISPTTGVPSFGDQYLPSAGWFFNVDIGVVAPRFKNQIQGSVPLSDGSVALVGVAGADLDWTVMPRLEVGYRLPLDLGSVLLGYRTLVSEGKEDLFDSAGNPATIKSRLNLNEVDLDYRSMDFDVGGKWLLFWRVGGRFTSAYYDSQLTSEMAKTLAGGAFLNARVTNNFVGGGPHAALEISHTFTPQFDFFANVDGAVLIGHVDQSYSESLTFGSGGAGIGGAATNSTTQAVPTLGIQLGVRWTPLGPDRVRFSLGYEYEYWWLIGQIGSGSAGELESQGIFFRSELRF
jgi:hypothetical protein